MADPRGMRNGGFRVSNKWEMRMTAVSAFYLASFVDTAIDKLFRNPGQTTKTHARIMRHTATVNAAGNKAQQDAIARIVAILQGGTETAANASKVRVTNILDRYATVQSPVGSPANDVMNLNVDRAVWINTGGGNDTLNINARDAAFIDTGTGDDLVNITARLAAFIRGGTGNDTINVTASDYAGAITGDQGDDIINVAARHVSFIDGGDGADVINIAADKAEWISGDAGDDILNIAAQRVWGVSGGRGNDVINIAGRAVRAIDGGAGNDVINIASGDVSRVYGQSGNDLINIAALRDALGVNGGAGGDLINITADKAYLVDGGVGDDRITINARAVNWVRGGKGNDFIKLVNATDVSVSFALGDGKDVYSLSGDVGEMRFDLEGGLKAKKAVVLEKYNLILITFENSDDVIVIDYKNVSSKSGSPSVVFPEDKSKIFITWN